MFTTLTVTTAIAAAFTITIRITGAVVVSNGKTATGKPVAVPS